MPMHIRRAAGAALAAALTCSAPALGQGTAPGNATILREDLRADLFYLASDEMGGRLADSPEARMAAAFVKSRFERLGLAPGAPGGSYYQPFNLVTAQLGDANALVVVADGGPTLHPAVGQDAYPLRFSPNAEARGEVVFAGFGITSPERAYDDYRGDPVRGKVVLVLDHEPGEEDPASPFDGLVTSEASRDLRKALYAQARGAVGILFVRDVHNHPGAFDFPGAAEGYWPASPRRIDRYLLADWVDRVRIPAMQVSPAVAEALVAGAGTLGELAAASETAAGRAPVPLPGVEVRMTTAVRRQVRSHRNVVAALEGADPVLRDEWIIICAHYDHEGVDGARVFNGADDDGSGTVGLLEIAEAYAEAARRGERPRRSVLFAAWNAEERGLLGAWAYTERPLVPLERTVAVLNMDMIGRNEEVPENGGGRFRGLEPQTAESNGNAVNLLGYSLVPDLAAEAQRANQAFGLELKLRYDNNPSNLLRRSDQWPFLQRGVPALFFHTGLHPDYHTADDRPERINYEKMERIVRLVHQLSWNLAQSDGRPEMRRVTSDGPGS